MLAMKGQPCAWPPHAGGSPLAGALPPLGAPAQTWKPTIAESTWPNIAAAASVHLGSALPAFSIQRLESASGSQWTHFALQQAVEAKVS